MVIDNLEIEIKKWDKGYSFSSEENDKKRIYTIYSPELKKKLREIISPCTVPNGVNMQYEGKNSYGDRIFYQQGKDDSPDQFTLTSREMITETELQQIENERKNWDDEWKQTREKWQKAETELKIPSSDVRHYWRGRDKDGKVVNEGMIFQSETQSHLITFENKKGSFPQIQGITDKKEEKKEIKLETNRQSSLQKDNNQNIYYGVGVITLVLLVISMMVVWVKRK